LRDQIEALRTGDYRKMAKIEAKDYATRGRKAGKPAAAKFSARRK
jgi:hypothetical protein